MLYQETRLGLPERFNAGLYERFMELRGTGRIRQTHYFAGRFENIYIEQTDFPEMVTVLERVKQRAAHLLARPPSALKAGFWFNAMQAGHRTTLHHHDENDELLSAVYYIRIPENSGNLVLHHDGEKILVRPQEGKLVMFAPSVPHEVTANLGVGLRLSVGMNIGPADGIVQ